MRNVRPCKYSRPCYNSFHGCLTGALLCSIKEIDRLKRKGMSNIYLKVTIEKN